MYSMILEFVCEHFKMNQKCTFKKKFFDKGLYVTKNYRPIEFGILTVIQFFTSVKSFFLILDLNFEDWRSF